MELSVLEICAGAGGQATGLEAARFGCAAAVEIDPHACATLRANRPFWKVLEGDVRNVKGKDFRGVDLLAGGVPCPPFSIAGRQLGKNDERDLFPEALRLIEEAKPSAVLLENVPGFAMARFLDYRRNLFQKLRKLGYEPDFAILNASSFGVPQLRPRFALVALKQRYAGSFDWPCSWEPPRTVGQAIGDLMAERGWEGARNWQRLACGIAPTIVGGSKKHGGPDLGPTRARKQWAALAVDGLGIANEAPGPEDPKNKKPRLTVRMVARLQGFSDSWVITGGKTAAYRQVGNAFPPPVAKALGESIRMALMANGASRQRQPFLFEAAS